MISNFFCLFFSDSTKVAGLYSLKILLNLDHGLLVCTGPLDWGGGALRETSALCFTVAGGPSGVAPASMYLMVLYHGLM